MVLKLERFNLEGLATRNTLKVLRHLILQPYLSWGLTELSLELGISKSNLLRIFKVLKSQNILLEVKSKRKKLYRINSELTIVKRYHQLFMEEKRQNISLEFKNVLDLFYQQIKDEVEVFILLGSVAQGVESPQSDLDILLVPKKVLEIDKYQYLPRRLEVHQYRWEDIEDPVDLVVLEALLHGIVFKGNVFPIISHLKSFPKAYLIYRLEKAKEFEKKAQKLEGAGSDYYLHLAKVTVGEVASLLKTGKTVPKAEIDLNNLQKTMKWIENRLGREGDRVWILRYE